MIPLRRSSTDAAPQPVGAADVVARLASCHERIRHFLAEAQALARGEGDAEQRRVSAQAVLSYFRFAMPLHEADEDASIAPRLRFRSSVLGRAVLTRMEEHGAIDYAVEVLAADWERWAEEPFAPVHIEAHRVLLRDLGTTLERHLDIEERQLFPAIALLEEEDRRAIVSEMEDRRR